MSASFLNKSSPCSLSHPLSHPLRTGQICSLYSAQRRQRCLLRTAAEGREGEPDFITKVFGGLFGQNALKNESPFGMKRMAEEDMHELYPATTTEFADAVPGDDATVQLFRPLLAKTRLERRPLRLAYDAQVHGWSSKALHAQCDGYGAAASLSYELGLALAVVVARTAGDAVLGGYNAQGWIGLNEDRDSNAAFLFTWPNGDTTQRAEKLPKVGGPNQAVLDGSSSGIQFGAEGLTIGLQRGAEKLAKSRLGSYYAKLGSGKRSLFAPDEGGRAELVDLKVYVAEGPPEEWTLDGVMWKSKEGS